MCIRDRLLFPDDLAGIFVEGDQLGIQRTEDNQVAVQGSTCLLYTSDAADERSSVDLGGRRIITKKNTEEEPSSSHAYYNHTHTSPTIETTAEKDHSKNVQYA